MCYSNGRGYSSGLRRRLKEFPPRLRTSMFSIKNSIKLIYEVTMINGAWIKQCVLYEKAIALIIHIKAEKLGDEDERKT